MKGLREESILQGNLFWNVHPVAGNGVNGKRVVTI